MNGTYAPHHQSHNASQIVFEPMSDECSPFPMLSGTRQQLYETAEKDKGKSKAEKVTGWFVRLITDIRFYS